MKLQTQAMCLCSRKRLNVLLEGQTFRTLGNYSHHCEGLLFVDKIFFFLIYHVFMN